MAFGAIFSGIGKLLGSGTGQAVVEFIKGRFPAKLSEAEMAEITAAAVTADREHERALLGFAAKQDAAFDKRTIALEGTASDLKSIPFLGPVIIFARGMFRPVFAYFTLYLDAIWFTTDTTWSEQQNTAMIVINIIVLVFYYGERTVKNLLPMIGEVFGARGQKT